MSFVILDFLFDVLIFLINFNIILFGSVVSGTGSARLFEEPLAMVIPSTKTLKWPTNAGVFFTITTNYL
jgi:hypothetical protein